MGYVYNKTESKLCHLSFTLRKVCKKYNELNVMEFVKTFEVADFITIEKA